MAVPDLVEVPEHAAVEIDALAELRVADAIASVIQPAVGVVDEPMDVDAVITDFDGVHTDDAATVDEHGLESVRVSRSDGLGVASGGRLGIPFVIISTEVNPVVSARARKLGVEVLQGVQDKRTAVQHLAPRERCRCRTRRVPR